MKPVLKYGSPFWVLGQPVEHTLSPAIHNAAFEAADLPHRYFAQEVSPDELKIFFEFLEQLNFPGANITLPLKEKAVTLISESYHDDSVKKTGAANTVYNREGRLQLANTDVYGFKKLIEPSEEIIQKEPVLLLGAGGAARACVAGLKELGCRKLFLWNRTEKKAHSLAGQFESPPIKVLNRDELENHLPAVKLVVNATSLGLNRNDPSPFPVNNIAADMVGVDLIYNRETKFLRDFANRGKKASGGLEMLVHQAARAWQLWLNKQPDIETMLRAARQEL